MKTVLVLSLIFIYLIATAAFLVSSPSTSKSAETPFYVGVTFCGNTVSEAKLLVDRVKTYTNVFVLQSGPVSKNETATTEICDYAVAAGLNIIVYFGWFDPHYPWQVPWLDFAKQRWGNRLLGIYYYDEPGGIQLDYNWSHLFEMMKLVNASYYQTHAPALDAYINRSAISRDYDAAAEIYLNSVRTDPNLTAVKSRSLTAFTSDYLLYWFDYKGGFDVILAQFGWNSTLVQEIGLVRGAARMQNKQWGAIITWKYTQPPYLDSGEEIYNQMVMAYQAGAQYVIIFNYAKIQGNAYGSMTEEHFQALEGFWNNVVTAPRLRTIPDTSKAEAVLVLPKNYGWGMRQPDDRIWYWGPDEKSSQIWDVSRKLLSQYGLKLDIVYDDPAFPAADKYPQVYYWNQSI